VPNFLPKGRLHPINIFLRKSIIFFQKYGFEIVEGPEIDTEYYNFDALNIPRYHPARDMQDTFWLKDGRLLRTHTSTMQVRSMQNRKPPVRIIVPGKCFRHEATDASHETNFYQLEGFAIDSNLKISHLTSILNKFMKELFCLEVSTRFRPGYFAFVVPGIEMDIKLENEWQEILGAGMIHPNVLKNMKISPKKYTGFAFGMGMDRLMMLYYGINDIRLSYSGDLRFLKQF